MATDTTKSGEEEVKITFTAEQQARVDEIVRESQGRAGNEARARAAVAETKATELATQVSDLSKQLQKLQKGSGGSADEKTEIEQLRAKLDEVKSVQETSKAELDRKNQELAAKAKEALDARADAEGVRKQNAIQSAAGKNGFFNVDQVVKLTGDLVKYDATTKSFTVFTENGTERLNSEYKPMTLDEFYIEFAAKNPYLVRSDVKGGSGSSESVRTGVTGNGKFTVDQIFGKTSSGVLAQQLMKTNPAEYHRLKGVAKENGILA
jgi:hypothetical protein